MEKVMIQTIFTRKSFITISVSVFYALVLVFTGMCLDSGTELMSKKNPIALLAKGIGFKSIDPGTSGFICLVLVAFYAIVLVTALTYERRFAIVNNVKTLAPKMLGIYGATVGICLLLSLGFGMLCQRPLTGENLGNVLTFVGQSFALSLLIFLALTLVIGAVLMFVINLLNIDKPFKFFDEEKAPVFGDEDLVDADVKNSFDTEEPAVMPGFGDGTGVGGAGGGAGGVGDGETVVRTAEELDDREKVFPSLSRVDTEYEGFVNDVIETDDLTLSELATGFRNYLANVEKLYFDIDTIRFFISGFAASHFEILEGLSGTGKSSLPRYFAKYTGSRVLFMPVQATWRDKSNILGFFNEFSKTYTETDFLVELYRANYNPDRIQIFVLDEMNISRVEYYFADLLSVLEYPQDEWKLKVMQVPYNFIPPVKLEDGAVQIPANSYFVGTANKDDSTFTITDKVYDRAITMEFSDRNKAFTVNEATPTVKLSASKLQSLYDAALADEAALMNDTDMAKLNAVCDYVYEQFGIAIGNRILNQIEHIVPTFVACGGTKETAIDYMISKKLVGKIEGRFEDYVKDALKGLIELINKTYGPGVLKLTEKTARAIIKTL